MPKVYLKNNRVVFDGGHVTVKGRGEDGKTKVIASIHQPVWLGEDDQGTFAAYGKDMKVVDPGSVAPANVSTAGGTDTA